MSGVLKRNIRGIRDSLPSGYLLGRKAKGNGRAELIDLNTVGQRMAAIGAVASAGNLSALLDKIAGNTVGDVLTRTASGWKAQAASGGGGGSNYCGVQQAGNSVSGSAFATKGAIFQATGSLTVSALWAALSAAAGQSFLMTLATLSGNGAAPTITSIDAQTTAITPGAAVVATSVPCFQFSITPKKYSAGAVFAVMCTITSGSATTALPSVAGNNVISGMAPVQFLYWCREASLRPAVNDSFSGNTGTTSSSVFGFSWS